MRSLVGYLCQLHLQVVDLGVSLLELATQCLNDLLLLGVQLHSPLVKAVEGIVVLGLILRQLLHLF